jgi:hypothetical protein
LALRLGAPAAGDGTREVLDAIRDPAKLVVAAQEAIGDATDSEIAMLAQRLSKYLGTKGVPTGRIPAAFASITGPGDAQSAAILAHRQHAVLVQNDNMLRNAMGKDLAAPPLQDPGLVNAEPYLESSTDKRPDMSVGVTEYASFHPTVEVPTRLANKAIEEAALMAASRMKFLQGQSYREQIHKRVAVRIPSRKREPVS